MGGILAVIRRPDNFQPTGKPVTLKPTKGKPNRGAKTAKSLPYLLQNSQKSHGRKFLVDAP